MIICYVFVTLLLAPLIMFDINTYNKTNQIFVLVNLLHECRLLDWFALREKDLVVKVQRDCNTYRNYYNKCLQLLTQIKILFSVFVIITNHL